MENIYQDIAARTHLRGKVPVLIGFVCILLWIILGLLCGQIWIPLGCVFGQWLFGYLAAYGGRRSELGRHDAGQVLGLRRYVKRLPKNDINRFLRNDPDFYFNYAPYALALGVDREFAQALQKTRLSQCPWLTTGMDGHLTAPEWNQLLRDTVDSLDSMQRRLPLDRLLGK